MWKQRCSMGAEALQERVARNQDSFRQVNERIEPSNAAHAWVDPPYADWVCECAREDCSIPVQLTVGEYETIRSDPARFLVAPGDEHVLPDVEQVVERTDRYWVVEKLEHAGDVSEDLDPRADE
jgi:hypothetical protein